LDGERELTFEIEGSKRQIEQQVGRAVDHFCYPNGTREDVSREVVKAVQVAGFRTAVTTESGLNHVAGDPLRLLRIGVEPGLEADYFERCAAGFRV
jgi:peptidoglycan/xylan/chitin deacetylase (PgdA/CDA1 family)